MSAGTVAPLGKADLFQRFRLEHLSFRYDPILRQHWAPAPVDFDGPFPRGGFAIAGIIDFYPPSNIFGDEEAAPPAVHPHSLSSRLRDAARRLLDSFDIDIATDSEQGVRVAVNLGGQHYLFHYSAGAWMIFVSP